ncbi:peptide cleavage/export ABC transporter [Lactiplantibacillus pentosus]|uniref:peptide cleavage/export ABC transporter n=1 Tax=Lactiplantibacillus pentosus TaxID=1589 RepID=UPI003C1D00CE
MFKRYYTQQIDETDCGAAALSMILKFYGSHVSLALIRTKAQTDKTGTSALGILKASEYFHLHCSIVKFNKRNAAKSMLTFPTPFISHTKNEYGREHYLVVFKLTPDYIVIGDPNPSNKVQKISWSSFLKLSTGILIIAYPNSNYVSIHDNNDSFWKIIATLKPEKKTITAITLASLLASIIMIMNAYFLKNIINNLVPNKSLSKLNIMYVGLFVAYLFHGAFLFIQQSLSNSLGKQLSKSILLKYIHHLFHLPISFFGIRKTGELTSRLTDASNIINMLVQSTTTTILGLGTILITGFALCFLNLKLFLVSLLIIPIYLIIIRIFLSKFDQQNNKRLEKNAVFNTEFIEDLHGIESIKALNIADKQYHKIKDKFLASIDENYKYGLAVSIQNALKDIAQLICTLSILYLGSRLSMNGKLSLGSLVAFYTLLGYFMGPIESITSLQNLMQTAKVTNSRLNQILTIPSEKDHLPQNESKLINYKFKYIKFSHIYFGYKYGQKTLNDINCCIKANSSVAIVGPSGSGKTTLAKLLIQFSLPNSGKIMLDNLDLRQIPINTLRHIVTYLPQKPYMFSGSIFDNIVLGAPNKVSLKSVIKATKLAEIHSDILSLPNGYKTILGENFSLSEGQNQRITIARSLLTKSKVIIFDESTSSLDPLTEEKVIKNLLGLKNKTLIFIAHRLEVAQMTDSILVMNKGAILEKGNHDQLMSLNGEYSDLWNSNHHLNV